MLASIMFSLVVVGLMIWCGHVTANFAAERGRSKRFWFLWGALFFPLFRLRATTKKVGPPQLAASFIFPEPLQQVEPLPSAKVLASDLPLARSAGALMTQIGNDHLRTHP